LVSAIFFFEKNNMIILQKQQVCNTGRFSCRLWW
jgi:hypothetical protein